MTEDLHELAKIVSEYLDRFFDGLDELKNRLRESDENTESAAEQVADACEGFIWLTEALTKLRPSTGYQPDRKAVDQIMKSLYDGVANDDKKFVASALEFDAMPMVEAWKGLVGAVAFAAR